MISCYNLKIVAVAHGMHCRTIKKDIGKSIKTRHKILLITLTFCFGIHVCMHQLCVSKGRGISTVYNICAYC